MGCTLPNVESYHKATNYEAGTGIDRSNKREKSKHIWVFSMQ